MGGRRRLRDNLERMLPDHRSALGQELRREHRALVTSLAIDGDVLLQREANRVAWLGVRSRESGRVWGLLIEKRRSGRGRRPSPRALERARRAAALDDASYSQALDRLRQLVKGNGHGHDLASIVTAAHRETPR
jgi:hypothetical protein